jgi:glycolate oxidase iron-sulfur subunit
MKTSFTPVQLQNPEIAEANGILETCTHLGFCTGVCPTYVLFRDENDSPRGRIDLIRRMLEQGGAPDAKTVHHLDRCLSCLGCMTTCAVKVDYMHLIDRARIHIERHFRRPRADRLLRWLVAKTVPSPRRFRLALAGARLALPAVRWLPGRLANLIALGNQTAARRGAALPRIVAPEGPLRMRVALLTGCVQTVLAPEINGATARVLARLGCEVTLIAGCCGALVLHMGREREAKAAAHRTIAALDDPGFDAIVVNASGCGTTVKDYGHLFEADPTLADPARRIAARTLDISELLDRLGIPAPQVPPGFAIAYHDACSLQHGQKVIAAPRRVLGQAGFVVRDVPEGHFCCGSAGAYNLLQPDIAAALGQRKAGHVAATGAGAVVAGNIGCIIQLRRHTALPVLHTAELIDWATGGPLPPALEGRTLTRVPVAAAAPVADAAIW